MSPLFLSKIKVWLEEWQESSWYVKSIFSYALFYHSYTGMQQQWKKAIEEYKQLILLSEISSLYADLLAEEFNSLKWKQKKSQQREKSL
jgi:hypothetical protein